MRKRNENSRYYQRGSLNPDFALAFFEKTEEPTDPHWSGKRNLQIFKGHPPHIVGDFDSASGEALEYLNSFRRFRSVNFNPVKDFTDTEIAMELAMEEGADRIYILGGTGTRLDHVVANIKLPSHGPRAGKECILLLDAHNRIRLIGSAVEDQKNGTVRQVRLFVRLRRTGEGPDPPGLFLSVDRIRHDSGEPTASATR